MRDWSTLQPIGHAPGERSGRTTADRIYCDFFVFAPLAAPIFAGFFV